MKFVYVNNSNLTVSFGYKEQGRRGNLINTFINIVFSRYTGMLETIRMRKLGYPVRKKYSGFAARYRCLVAGRVPRGAPTKEIAR